MRIRQLASSLVMLTALNVVGYPIFAPTNLRCRDGMTYIDRQGRLLFDSSFTTGLTQWSAPLVNFENKLSLGCSTYEGEALFLAELKGGKCDTVLFENRTLDAKNGISDSFAPFAVHVYQLEY